MIHFAFGPSRWNPAGFLEQSGLKKLAPVFLGLLTAHAAELKTLGEQLAVDIFTYGKVSPQDGLVVLFGATPAWLKAL